jgi:intein-encoded DNA endonuclease-like protein
MENNWNKDEWINDLIEEISVKIQEGKIRYLVQIHNIVNQEIVDFCKVNLNSFNVIRSLNLNPSNIDNYHELNFEVFDIVELIEIRMTASTGLADLLRSEIDFPDLLLSNTII